MLRPLGSLEQRTPDTSRLKVLFPFGDFESSPEGDRYRLMPVFHHRRRPKQPGGDDVDTWVFPLFFWGDDPHEGGYFAFFPFGGSVKGLLGQERIDFAMFPIWAQLHHEDRVSTHILWPFGNHVTGAGWSGGRVWPFWGEYQWRTEDGTLRSQREFILWPFYMRGQEYVQEIPTAWFFTFPFYGYRENRLTSTRTYLWPLIVTHYENKYDDYTVGGYFFPYRFSDVQFDPWPLFGWKWKGPRVFTGSERSRDRLFFLWPFVRYDRGTDRREESLRLWALPVFYYYGYVDKIVLEEKTRWKVWPIIGYQRDGPEVGFDVLSPLWFDWTSYERLYGRLVAFFRYRSRGEVQAGEVLYGTLYWETGPETALVSVLGGLLEVRTQRTGFRMRLLWIPWW